MINRIKKSNLLFVLFDILLIAICYIISLYVLDFENPDEIAVIRNIALSIFVYQVF